jgi:hypothetical protein
MITLGPPALLQRIIGPRDIGEARTEPHPRPVAARAREKVRHGRSQGAGFVSMTSHGSEQPLQAFFALGRFARRVIGQQRRRPMPPLVGPLDGGPARGGFGSSRVYKGLEAFQGLRQGPLFAPRSTRWSMAESRVWSWRPEASNGGRPSSVSALRTARQSPRMPAASGSLRPSPWRAIGRTPRPRFVRAFLAWRSAAEIGLAASRREWKWPS